MINNYYNIPNIPCDARENITNTPINQQKCSGLNPDNVYNTLYPSNSDPLVNYSTHNSKKLTIGSKISSSLKDTNNCAINCENDNNCTYFTVKKDNNKCFLYNKSATSANNKFQSLEASNSLQTWRKNSLLEGTSNCKLDDNFINQPSNFFPDVTKYTDAVQTISQPDLSKDECLSACLYDSNCKSVVFADAKSSCEQYNANRQDVLRDVQTAAYDDSTSKTYIKNATQVGNRFGAPNNLSTYYKKYPKKGKIGDSFCELVDSTCKTSYIVGPDDTKKVPKTGSATSAKTIPSPKICMPPDCVPSAPNTGLKGILKVNGNMNIMCKDGDTECRKNIEKTPYFTTDQMGLPTAYGAPSPPNPYLPFTSQYNKYDNLNITSSEMAEKPPVGAYDFPEGCKNWCSNSMDCGGYSYKFGTDGKAQCKYYQNNDMKTLRDSLRYENHTTANIKRGNPLIQEPQLSQLKKPYFNNFTTAQTGVNKIKTCINKNRYIPPSTASTSGSSSQSNIFKNKCKEGFTGDITEELRVRNECGIGFQKCKTDPKYCYYPEDNKMYSTYCLSAYDDCNKPNLVIDGTKYWFRQVGKNRTFCKAGYEPVFKGYCPDGVVKKENAQGSNCPTPLKDCDKTEYGCCSDNQTAKIDKNGMNCPIINKDVCLKSKYGCCPGTIVPKEYLCDSTTNPMCNLTNCALNERQVGDPYAFTEGSNKKCSNNKDCNTGEMCINGICKKYNEDYYNSLNFVQSADKATKSGSSLNDFMCGVNASAKPNKKCSNDYEPVCGTDGKNYQNSCKALNSGTKIQHSGTCEPLLEMFYGDMGNSKPKTNKMYYLLFVLLFAIIAVLLLRI